MKTLQDWWTKQIRAQRPGARETNRSEMVAAALDAYLPASAGQGKKAEVRPPEPGEQASGALRAHQAKQLCATKHRERHSQQASTSSTGQPSTVW